MTLFLQTDFEQIYPGIFCVHTKPRTETVTQYQYERLIIRMRGLENYAKNRQQKR